MEPSCIENEPIFSSLEPNCNSNPYTKESFSAFFYDTLSTQFYVVSHIEKRAGIGVLKGHLFVLFIHPVVKVFGNPVVDVFSIFCP